MDILFEKYWSRLHNTNFHFVRGLYEQINWNARLIGIKGARGVGKTTFLLQYLKKNTTLDEATLYASLDNIWFSENSLSEMAEDFVKRGGRNLFLDEVHKYPNWAQELKNLYDDYPQLKVVFTGSSLLEILNSRADLSRRAIVYEMKGLSFREYLNMFCGANLHIFSLDDILTRHISLANEIISQIKPLQHFNSYLKNGYYPFFSEYPDLYHLRLEEIINMIIEIELPLLRGMDIAYIKKIKQILQIISESVPFIPNISKLSERIGINRITFLTYLNYLNEVQIINSVFRDAHGITKLQKPDKIFLENTNLIFTLASENGNKGNLRETFFVNQLIYNHTVEIPDQGDFLIDGNFHIEVGGKEKSSGQIRNLTNAFIAADDIEFGFENKIPLWLFGFLY